VAVLIPALSAAASRMASGERRLAERLEQKIDDDYLLWYDVSVCPKQTHPDFVIIHPRRGFLILETKDWKLDTIQEATKQAWTLLGISVVGLPLIDKARYKLSRGMSARSATCAMPCASAT
jgi:hypothetical protein